MVDALLEPLKIQTRLEMKLTDQDGRSSRDNIRIHEGCEGAEENSPSVISSEKLLIETLDPSTCK